MRFKWLRQALFLEIPLKRSNNYFAIFLNFNPFNSEKNDGCSKKADIVLFNILN